ncbi:hypothetical protein ES703_108767 [subsurface metagenome]
MHIISHDFWLNSKQLFIELNSIFEVLQRFHILHITDMLADKGVLIFSQTEGILLFGTAGKDLL